MGQSWRLHTYLPEPSLQDATNMQRSVTVKTELKTRVSDLNDREITPSSTTNQEENDDFVGYCTVLSLGFGRPVLTGL